MASFKFSKSMMDKMVSIEISRGSIPPYRVMDRCTTWCGSDLSYLDKVFEAAHEYIDTVKSGDREMPDKSTPMLVFTYYHGFNDILLSFMNATNSYVENSIEISIEEFMENQVFSSAACDNQTILDELHRLAGDETKKMVVEKINADADKTISALVGPFWSCEVNKYGSVSGQDRVHPKAGLLTVRQILEFYTNADGEVDFGHFTQLKDLVNNRSMNFKKRSHWPQRQQHTPRPQQYAPQQHAPQPREWTPNKKWSPPLPQAPSVDQGQLTQLMKMVEQLSKTVETLQTNDAAKQTQIEALKVNDAAKQAQIDAQQAEIDALKEQIDAKTQKQQKIESLQKQLAELL